jgi:hypothetical protein
MSLIIMLSDYRGSYVFTCTMLALLMLLASGLLASGFRVLNRDANPKSGFGLLFILAAWLLPFLGYYWLLVP